MADEQEPGPFDSIEPYPERRTTRRGRRLLAIAVAVIAFGGFAGLIYYAYSKGREAGSSGIAPIIRAGDGPTKVRPDQPGGMQVPDQDKEVYSRIGPEQGSGGQRVENLLPPPEQPLPRTALRQVPEPPPGAMLGPATAPPLPPPPPIAGVGTPQGLDTGPAATPSPAPPAASAPPAPPAPPQAPAARATPPSKAAAPPRAASPAPQRPPQTAAIAPAAGSYRVQLVALRSEEAALAEWDKLKKANPDLFNGLNPNVVRVDLGAKGVYYRLQVGPLAGEPQATDLCEKAKSRKLGCIVVRP